MTFWFNDPMVLFNKNQIFNIWPLTHQSLDDKLNSVTRLIIILTIVGFIITRNFRILITSFITLLVLVFIHKNKKNIITKKKLNSINENFINNKKDTASSQEKFTKPSEKNPLMNVLLPEIKYNPKRKAAAPSFNPEVEKEINEKTKKSGLDSKLFLDLGDNINFERNFNLDQSMQRFYTTANSKVGNDQAAFAKFCYGNMLSCKDGDTIQCEKNSKRWINY